MAACIRLLTLYSFHHHTSTRTHTHARTHTHTHLYVWFTGTLHRWVLLYCTRCISYPLTLNLPITENSAFLDFQKRKETIKYVLSPHKPCSRCNTYVIIHFCVLIKQINLYKHTHTQVSMFMGTFHRCNVFFFTCKYVSPYSAPTLKPTPHTKLSAILYIF